MYNVTSVAQFKERITSELFQQKKDLLRDIFENLAVETVETYYYEIGGFCTEAYSGLSRTSEMEHFCKLLVRRLIGL